jgi:membrane associated rhomboid family serine protease
VGVVKQKLSKQKERWLPGALLVLAMAGIMWVLEVVNSLDSQRLDQDGIVPRSFSHIYGILLAPFLHASFGHLLDNTLPFLVLGFTIALASAGRVLAVTVIVGLTSGIGTWLIAPAHTDTVGASGIVFGYATYLICRGFIDRHAGEITIGVVVGLLFGGALISGLIPHAGISWQAHLFGGIGGVIAAQMLTTARGGDPPMSNAKAARISSG